MSELMRVILGGGISAAIVSGTVQLILWRWNRRAAKEDVETKSEKQIKNALKMILYDRIKYLGRKYLDNGFISLEDLEDLLQMHKIYHDDLGGNGFLDNIMNQVKQLPLNKK